jgi:hypothetical protein
MAGGKSTTYQNNFLTWALTTATAPTRPTSYSLALYTDATGATSAPTAEATTGNCPGYVRQAVSFGASAATGGQIANTGVVTFTATGAWATVNYYGILDQAGTLIYWCPLSASRTLALSGDKIDFAIGAIVAQEK